MISENMRVSFSPRSARAPAVILSVRPQSSPQVHTAYISLPSAPSSSIRRKNLSMLTAGPQEWTGKTNMTNGEVLTSKRHSPFFIASATETGVMSKCLPNCLAAHSELPVAEK